MATASIRKKEESLRKMTLLDLKDTLHRENLLVQNWKLIDKLPDKGESVKKFRDLVQKEIDHREQLNQIEESVNKLSISSSDKEEQYVQRICDIEKSPQKERYKPFATLNSVQEIKENSNIFKIMEDCRQYSHPSKLIPLSESITILKQHELKEEQLKIQREHVDNTDQDEKSDSELSESEH